YRDVLGDPLVALPPPPGRRLRLHRPRHRGPPPHARRPGRGPPSVPRPPAARRRPPRLRLGPADIAVTAPWTGGPALVRPRPVGCACRSLRALWAGWLLGVGQRRLRAGPAHLAGDRQPVIDH